MFSSVISIIIKLLMVTNSRDRVKFIAIAGIVVLFLVGANFGNAQTMEKVDCDALFSKHLGAYGYESDDAFMQNPSGKYQSCGWGLSPINTQTAFTQEADALVFPLVGAELVIKSSPDTQGNSQWNRLQEQKNNLEASGANDFQEVLRITGGTLAFGFNEGKSASVDRNGRQNSWVKFYAETGKCMLFLNGKAGVGVAGQEYLPNYKDFHRFEHNEAINEHPEFDHGQNTAQKEILQTVEQLIADLEPLCGATVTPVTEEKVEETLAQFTEKTQEIETAPVPALVADTPSEADLPINKDNENLTIRVIELEGLADMQLPDGTWKPANLGDEFPVYSMISVGYDSIVTIQFSNKAVIVLPPLTEIRLIDFINDPQAMDWQTEV